jgi:DNA anti-recombination protein RmuC
VKRLSEEIKPKEEEKPPREEIPVPLYFDRYVAGELHSLGNRITQIDSSLSNRITQVDNSLSNRITQVDRRIADLKESMDERFVQVDRRFADLKDSIDGRFVQFDKRMDERFARDKERIDNLQESVNKLGANIKWTIGLFSPVIIGILAIIIKMFFGP